jgi:hypothetical protein
MVVRSEVGYVSILLAMCKTVLFVGSVMNLHWCAKRQEWQVFLTQFLQNLFVDITEAPQDPYIKAKAPTWILGFVLHPPVYNSNIIMHNHNRISFGSLFFHLYMHVLIKWSELWKLGTMMPWTFLDPNTRNLIYLLEYYLTTMAHFMVCEPGPSNF